MLTDFTVAITEDSLQRIENLGATGKTQGSLEDVAQYALLLGLKILESGLDSDTLIRSLQEPGTGLDIDLLMAKRRSRNDKQKPQDMAIKAFVIKDDPSLIESLSKISAEDYSNADFE